MTYVVDVENWIRFEEELVELEMFRNNEEIRIQAIQTANDMREGELGTIEIVSHAKEDESYKFIFNVELDEDGEEEKSYIIVFALRCNAYKRVSISW